MEQWKNINSNYQVSNYGNVRGVDRYVMCRNGHTRLQKGIILKQRLNKKTGYMQVLLNYGKGIKKMFNIHRLVAEAFIPNPNKYIEINHKDCDKTNNVVSNLEWCDRSYNFNYADANEKRGKTHKRKIIVDGVKVYDGIIDAAKDLGLRYDAILKVLNGKNKHHHNHTFEYYD